MILTCLLLMSGLFIVREAEYQLAQAQEPKPITVYVTGEVAQPGAVTLPRGARRIHAISLCGGVTVNADLDRCGPAEHLRDGETVIVGARIPARPAGPGLSNISEGLLNSPLDLNSASAEELQELPGVGPVLAQRILEARLRRPQGSFRSLEDLAAIRGIKRKTLARIRGCAEVRCPEQGAETDRFREIESRSENQKAYDR